MAQAVSPGRRWTVVSTTNWFSVPAWTLCAAFSWPLPMWSSFMRMNVASGSVFEKLPLPSKVACCPSCLSMRGR